MFEKLFEKRNLNSDNSFDWTAWVKGEDSELIGVDSTYAKCINLFSENIAKLPIVTKVKTEKGDIDADNFYLYEINL